MTYDPKKHYRRSIRLCGYDYAQPGAYFVTLCVQEHVCLFGEITNEAISVPTAPAAASKRKPLGRLVGAFKTVSTKRINRLWETPGERVWQRNFYERVIRGEDELRRIRRYIADNPLRWHFDRYHPDRP